MNFHPQLVNGMNDEHIPHPCVTSGYEKPCNKSFVDYRYCLTFSILFTQLIILAIKIKYLYFQDEDTVPEYH